jgi:hypothetical protein
MAAKMPQAIKCTPAINIEEKTCFEFIIVWDELFAPLPDSASHLDFMNGLCKNPSRVTTEKPSKSR